MPLPASTLNEYGPAAVARGYNTYDERVRRDNKKFGWRDILTHAVLPTVAFATGGAALGALGAGGAAGAAGSAAGSSSVPVIGGTAPGVAHAAGRFTLPNLLRMAEIGVPAVTSLFGARAQNNALKRQAAQEQQTIAEQLAFAREQEAARKAEYDRQMAEEARRWDIEQANRARELAAVEEDRAFQRRLVEEREARKAQARMRLADFLGRGR